MEIITLRLPTPKPHFQPRSRNVVRPKKVLTQVLRRLARRPTTDCVDGVEFDLDCEDRDVSSVSQILDSQKNVQNKFEEVLKKCSTTRGLCEKLLGMDAALAPATPRCRKSKPTRQG